MIETTTVGSTRGLSRRVEKLESEIIYRDILLEEIIHRTKNILQLAVSVLGEQADCARDPFSRHVIRGTQKQMVTLCQTQNRLFGPNIAGRSLSARIADICAAVLESFASRSGRVVIETDIAEISLSRHQEVCLSLMLQELLINALKHAFPGGMEGVITVELQADAGADCRLTVRDNGVGRQHGFPPSTGMTVVRDFASALGGSFTITSDRGTIAEVRFPISNVDSGQHGFSACQPDVIEHPPGYRVTTEPVIQ